MDATDNPYDVLGVAPDADAATIKRAYRKLALQHHPDKQPDPAARQHATAQFAKISNAYELLSDPAQRQQFDHQQNSSSSHDAFFADFFDRRRGHRTHFHDPFAVFHAVFQEEFGGGTARAPFGGQQYQDPFDSFFGHSFGSGFFGGARQRTMDPFGDMMGSGLLGGMMGARGNGRRGHHDPFESMFQSLHNNNSGHSTSSFSYSSSSFGGGRNGANGGESVSTSTTTRIINGKRQTVTETVRRKADGTVERHVDTQGDPDFAALNDDKGNGDYRHHRALPAQNNDQRISKRKRDKSGGGSKL